MGRTSERSGLQRGSVDSSLQPQRAARKPARDGAAMLDAQRGLGNQEVLRRLGLPVQPKLTVNAPGDAYEMEADRMADAIVRSPDRPGATPKPVGTVLQRKPTDGAAQRAPKSDDKKKPDAQKAPEKKGDEKKKPDAQKAPEKKGDEKKKPDAQKAPEKKGDEKKKPDAQKAPEKKGDEKKKPDAQKAPEKKKGEEAPKVQRAPDEGRTLEQEALERDRRRDEDAAAPVAVQAKEEDGGGAAAVPEDVERVIQQQRGRGEPLSPQDRAFLEPRFGQDLSGVRIHTDGEAQRAAQRLGARAFTVGRDIFFAPGRFSPQTQEGLWLLAHEVTHTVQQQPAGPPKAAAGSAGGVVQAPGPQGAAAPGGSPPVPEPAAPLTPAPADVVQRLPSPAPGKDPERFTKRHGRLNEAGKTLAFDRLKIPSFKYWGHRRARWDGAELKRPRAYNRDEAAPEDQRGVWDGSFEGAVLTRHEAALEAMRPRTGGVPPDQPRVWRMKQRGGADRGFFVGTPATVARRLLRPPYNREGRSMQFHVDHIVELQVGGSNDVSNMELLKGAPNEASGRIVRGDIVRRVREFLVHLTDGDRYAQPVNINAVKREYDITFDGVDASVNLNVERDQFWTRNQILQGQHLDLLMGSNLNELNGSPDDVLTFRSANMGMAALINRSGGVDPALNAWVSPFEVTGVQWTPSDARKWGRLTFRLPETHKQWEADGAQAQADILRMPDLPNAGYVDMQAVRDAVRPFRKKGLSPIEVTSVTDTDQGLEFRGQIISDIPLIRGTRIDFRAIGDAVTFSKTFSTDDFKQIPAPFRISEAALTIAVGNQEPGFELIGSVSFEVQRLGEGYLEASASARGFDILGKFTFDTSLFDPADITLRYQDQRFSAEGDLGIKEGKVPGVRSASIHAEYRDQTFSANGSAELSVPGVDRATLAARYNQEQGFEVSGTATLAGNIPGIQGGELQARLRKKAEGDWEVFASGTARPKLPVAATLSITYEDGALTIEGTGEYARGMMRGSITLGATNRPVGDDGRPVAGAEGGSELSAYGSGTVTIRFAPWLQGTVGVRLTRTGEIEVRGEVSLPSALDLVPEKSYSRTLVSVGLDIPIVGVAVAGQRIGIFATIRGSLTFNAGVGPGQLRDVRLGVQYNPSQEDQTRVWGSARLHVPAHAGLRLAIQGGIGAGIPIVSATAGLEIGGELGVHGALSAGVNVDWTPARGLVIDAEAEIFAEPKLKFDVSGFVDVSADLLLTTVELYHKRWQLAAIEMGSNLRLGMRLPLHYEQGRDFDVSWDQVQFTIPQIDPADTLRQLIRRVI